MSRFLALLAGVALTGFSLVKLQQLTPPPQKDEEQLIELRFIPNGQHLNAVSLGYKNALADTLWFTAINYFGKHYRGDKDLRWLSHLCSLVVSLDPKAQHVYEFCGTMLSWELSQPNDAYRILSQGVTNIPNNWYLLYLRGFTALHFLKNTSAAKDDFIAATNLPNCPVFVARLAVSTAAQLESPDTTAAFLESLIMRTQDESAKRSLLQKKETLFRSNSGQLSKD